jgi:hypothetical protein
MLVTASWTHRRSLEGDIVGCNLRADRVAQDVSYDASFGIGVMTENVH